MSHTRIVPDLKFHNALTKLPGASYYKVDSPLIHKYTFNFFEKLALKEEVSQYLDIGVYREMVRKAMSIWEGIADVQFIEDDEDATLHIARYIGTSSFDAVEGFSSKYPNETVALRNQIFDNEALNAEQLSIVIHELGHVLNLKHPFEPPYALTDSLQISRSFSVMNYEELLTKNFEAIIPISPLPVDMEVAQYLYGARSVKTDDIYHLRNYIPENMETFLHISAPSMIRYIFSHIVKGKTLASFWDAGGIDTLSAKDIQKSVTINIRPYSISKIEDDGLLLLPNIEIENIIGGKGRNELYLNALNNTVDIGDAKLSSTLYIDGLECGQDIIMGFSPQKDFIVFEQMPTDSKLELVIYPQQNDTIIYLNENNTILLKNVSYHELHENNIRRINHPQFTRPRTLNSIEMPEGMPLITAFKMEAYFAYGRGFVGSTFSTLLDVIFKKSKLSEKQVLLLKTALLLVMANNSLFTFGMILVNVFSTQLGLSKKKADFLNIVIHEIARINQPFNLFFFTRASTNILSCILGQYTSLILCNQVRHCFSKKKSDEVKEEEIDIEQQVPLSKNKKQEVLHKPNKDKDHENHYGCLSRVKKLYQGCRFFSSMADYLCINKNGSEIKPPLEMKKTARIFL